MKTSRFIVTIKHDGSIAPGWMKQDIREVFADWDEVKKVTVKSYPKSNDEVTK